METLHGWNQITGNFDLYGEARLKTQPEPSVKRQMADETEAKHRACECLIHTKHASKLSVTAGISMDLQAPAKGERA